ncbi:QsdR family transcriptional regulator [Nocardia paucivorans]|uniref:QsdR family transcriptional regulator n=1 Tax=Nocardia paucivorans TaxID=114259 RepID=UPI0002DEBFBC|nr:QsdR family transcriptional regulator [Nocardia paucivorans]
MKTVSNAARPPGRPASATREQVVELARQAFLAGERVDIQAIAAQLRLSRASVYRWFGSRDGVLGAVLAGEFEALIDRADARRRSSGARRILDVLDRVNRWMAGNEPFRRYFENEPIAGLRILTSSDGPVQPRVLAAVETLIARAEEDGYRPLLERSLLAYSLVRLGEAFLYNDNVTGLRGDVDRLYQVQAALLNISPDISPDGE